MAGVRVAGLTKSYGRVRVLDDLSFDLPPGTITGLLGPNGAGKTTLLRMMVGLGRPDSGEVLFEGRRYRDLPEPTSVVGCLLDASAHHSGRTVDQTVSLFARSLGLSRARALASLDEVGLSSVLSRRFGALSLGMKQRVGLAMALIGNPTHLLLDEPMNGLDIETTAWVRKILTDFAERDGGCVLVSSHLLQELQSFAHRIVVISKGSLGFQGAMDEIRNRQVSLVRSPELPVLMDSLRSADLAFDGPDVDGRLTVMADSASVGQIARSDGIWLEELVPGGERALESFYLSVTQGSFVAGEER